jgi:hypothetical protein
MLPVPPVVPIITTNTSSTKTTAAVPANSLSNTTSAVDAAVTCTVDERHIDQDLFNWLIQDKGTDLAEGDPVPNDWYYDADGK